MMLQTLFDKIGISLEPQAQEFELESEIIEKVLPVRNPYVVSQRIVLCGAFLEHYEYKAPYVKGMPREWRPEPLNRCLKPQMEITEANVSRARTRIRRLVNSNSELNNFLTLTYNRSMTDFEGSNLFFENFIKRVRRIMPDFKYLAVPEFQKDNDYYGRPKPHGGNIHYHLLCNWPLPEFSKNPQIAELEMQAFEKDFEDKIWLGGFCDFREITNIDNVGAYVCKYLGKANFDKRFFGKKKFFYSRNLVKPLVVDKLCEVLEMLDFFCLKSLTERFKMTFDSKYFGAVQYTQYCIKSINNIFDFNKVVST